MHASHFATLIDEVSIRLDEGHLFLFTRSGVTLNDAAVEINGKSGTAMLIRIERPVGDVIVRDQVTAVSHREHRTYSQRPIHESLRLGVDRGMWSEQKLGTFKRKYSGDLRIGLVATRS